MVNRLRRSRASVPDDIESWVCTLSPEQRNVVVRAVVDTNVFTTYCVDRDAVRDECSNITFDVGRLVCPHVGGFVDVDNTAAFDDIAHDVGRSAVPVLYPGQVGLEWVTRQRARVAAVTCVPVDVEVLRRVGDRGLRPLVYTELTEPVRDRALEVLRAGTEVQAVVGRDNGRSRDDRVVPPIAACARPKRDSRVRTSLRVT